MRLSRAAVASVLWLSLAATASAQGPDRRFRVEGVAALVGGNAPGAGAVFVLRSDVELRARMQLAGRTDHVPTGPLRGPLLAAALQEIIGEILIAREADRLRAASPSDAEVAEELVRMQARSGGAERLEAVLSYVGATPDELDDIARRRTYVDAFLRANLEGSTVISDAQVERTYEAGEHPFVGRPLADVWDPLRAWLAAASLQRDVARWIEVLRSRTQVRVLAEWRSDG